jgi:hypothetical protein
MTNSYALSLSGRIQPDGISIAEIGEKTFILIGTSDGELSLYTIDSEIPEKHASNIGGITIVDFRYFKNFQKTVAIVILLENTCSFFEIEGKSNEWEPIHSQPLIFNPSCYSIFEGKSGSELLLGTHQGGIGYFIENPSIQKSEIIWKYSNYWSLKHGVSAISHVKKDSFIICRGDGNAFLFSIKENPERVTDFLVEVQVKDTFPIILRYNPLNDMVFGATGDGKVFKTNLKKKLEISELELKKRPIFVDFWKDEIHGIVGIIGTPDGCLYFFTDRIKNLYRHEEPVQSFYISKTSKFILVIVGLSGTISFFRYFQVFEHRIPRFYEVAMNDLVNLRNVIKDEDTSDEVFISTYLYMPLL